MNDGDTGLESPPVAESPAPVEDTGSLAEFEQAFHGAGPSPEDEIDDVELDPTPVDTRQRNEAGQFVKPKHKAERFQATAKDHELINGFTRRIKEAEALHGKDITQQAGESNRVFELRRRAELAERRAQVASVSVPRETPSPIAAKLVETPRTVVSSNEPVVTEFPDYEAYVKALAKWTVNEERKAWQAEEVAAREREHQATIQSALKTSWDGKIAAAKAKYPDFEAVALHAPTSIPQDSSIDKWILGHKAGADVLYHLQTHPNEVMQLLALPTEVEQVEALTFLTRRLTTPTREATESTGAVPAPVTSSAPRPPTPVRTGPMRPADDPVDPGNVDLSGFAKAFPSKR